jgi:hypothetical protein
MSLHSRRQHAVAQTPRLSSFGRSAGFSMFSCALGSQIPMGEPEATGGGWSDGMIDGGALEVASGVP